MKPTREGLAGQFKELIGPEAFAKAEAAIAAAKATEAAAAALRAAAAKPAPAPVPPNAAASAATVASVTPNGVPVAAPTRASVAAAAPVTATAARPAPAAAPATPRPTVAAPALAPVVTLPLQQTEHAARGYDLDATVAPNQVVDAARLLDRSSFALDTITGVDWLAQGEMEVVYDYLHFTESLRVVVRTRVPRATPELPSIVSIYPGANWHERETHDFFGIRFIGHPNLKPFLLPEDAKFHPLRKDYQP